MTFKQRAFVAEYLKDLNATAAALRAKYSPRTAYSIGHENLKKPEIAAAIAEALEQHAMSAAEALVRLSNIARGDMGDFIDEDGWLDLAKVRKLGLTPLIQELIPERRVDADGAVVEKVKLKLYSAHSALVDLLKIHGRFVERRDITSGGEPIKVYAGINPNEL